MNKKVVKAGIGYTVGNYLLKGLTFFTLPIYARMLSTEDFGYYSVFLSYETILFIVLGFAIHSSYKSAKYRFDDQKGYSYANYVSSTMILLCTSTFIWLLAVNIFSKSFSRLLGLDRLSLNLLVLLSFSTAVISCFNADASLNYKYNSYLLVSGINAISNTILSIILILTLFQKNRYMGRVLGTLVPILCLAVLIVIKYIGLARPNRINEYLKWGLRYSFPIIFHGISQVILGQFDRIMIKSIQNVAVSGIYSFAYNIFTVVQVTANSLDSVWSTWAFERLNVQDYKSIRKYSNYYVLGMFIFFICIMLVSPELILFLGSKKYTDARYVVIPIICAGYFTFLYTLPSVIEYYYEKTKYMAVSTIMAAVINIGLNAYFIRKYGYVAAAYTTLFTYILYFLLHLIISKIIIGKFIFSTKYLLVTSIVVIVMNFLCIILIDMWIIRWGLTLILVIVSLVFEERNFGIIRLRLKKNES